jgi:hypothetical protein
MTGAHAPVLKGLKFNCVKNTQRAKSKEQGARRKYSKRKENENIIRNFQQRVVTFHNT